MSGAAGEAAQEEHADGPQSGAAEEAVPEEHADERHEGTAEESVPEDHADECHEGIAEEADEHADECHEGTPRSAMSGTPRGGRPEERADERSERSHHVRLSLDERQEWRCERRLSWKDMPISVIMARRPSARWNERTCR